MGLGNALVRPNGKEGEYDAVRAAAETVLEKIASIRAVIRG